MPMVLVNGTRLHYHVKGEGIPIVFITPPLMTRAIFTYQYEQLSAFFKVVTFDIRGHGLSSPSEAPLTYSLISEDILQLMNELELSKAYLCGYSTGSTIALDAMLSHPSRFYGGILLSGMSELTDVYNRARLTAALALCNSKMKKTLAYAICKGNSDSSSTFSNLYGEAMNGNVENWEQYYRCSYSYSNTSKLRKIHSPMLLMYGKKDYGFYRYARMLQRELLDNKLIAVNDVGHQLPTKAADAVNRVIRSWVQESAKRSSIEPFMIDAFNRQLQNEQQAYF